MADGASHPLSSRFPSLAAAKAVYPHASALTDEIDWCVLQGAINATAARGGGAVQVPNTGRPYLLNKDLVINPNLVTMRGEGSALHFGKLKGPQRAIWFKADGAPNGSVASFAAWRDRGQALAWRDSGWRKFGRH